MDDNRDGGGQLARTAGALMDACSIDLPTNDVVEAIEFERFFVLDFRYNEFQRPATLMSAWVSLSDGLSPEELLGVAPAIRNGAPFSTRREDWEPLVHRDDSPVAEADLPPPEPVPFRRSAAPPAPGVPRTADEPDPPDAPAAAGVLGPQQNLGASASGSSGPNLAGFRLAFYLPYRQEWKLDGYSRGRMVNSLTLGPQEEQTIEIFTWDRVSSTSDSTTSYENEETNESSGTRRDTADITSDIARQAGFELTSDAKVGFKVEVVNVDITSGMNAKTSVNSSEKQARQSIVEATARAATHVRSSRTLKVVQTREYGQETRVTRTLRNHNTCHTLTTAFFEILANYTVSTFLKTDAVRLVVLLKSSELSKIKNFDRRLVRSHERTLRLALLDSTLAPGLDAARYLDARDRACAILCGGCECSPGSGGSTRDREWDAVADALEKVGIAVAALRSYIVLFPLSVAIARFELPPGTGMGTMDIRRDMFMRALQAHAPRLLADLGGLSLVASTLTPTAADAAMAVINALTPESLGLLAADPKISGDEWWLIYAVVFPTTPAPEPISQAAITAAVTGIFVGAIGGLAAFDDGGLLAAINVAKGAYSVWQASLAEKLENDVKLAELARIAAEERALRVLDSFPLRETADAQERLDALLDHLNDERNIDHYRFAVWNERAGSTDPQLLALALAGFTEGAPVGVVGDDLAVAVRLPPGSLLEKFFDDSIADLVAMTPRDDDDHLLPTAALYAEAIPGVCCSCEDNAVKSEELDLARKVLDNDLLRLEADRLTARLSAHQLDPPGNAAPIRVEVTNAAAP